MVMCFFFLGEKVETLTRRTTMKDRLKKEEEGVYVSVCVYICSDT